MTYMNFFISGVKSALVLRPVMLKAIQAIPLTQLLMLPPELL